MERHSKGSPAYMDDLLKRVENQITISKNLIAVCKDTVAKSKEQYPQHTVETEVYKDLLKIKK